MNAFSVASSIIAICLYVPLCLQIFSGKTVQNFATWMLWAILDAIAAAATISQEGNFLLPLAYSVGSTLVTLSILKSKNFKWTWFETMDTFMVGICLVIWHNSGARTAIIASTMAVVIAGLPQTVESLKKPREQPFLIYLGFFTTSILTTIGGKDWSVEERFYGYSCAVMGLVILIFVIQKFWGKMKTTQTA